MKRLTLTLAAALTGALPGFAQDVDYKAKADRMISITIVTVREYLDAGSPDLDVLAGNLRAVRSADLVSISQYARVDQDCRSAVKNALMKGWENRATTFARSAAISKTFAPRAVHSSGWLHSDVSVQVRPSLAGSPRSLVLSGTALQSYLKGRGLGDWQTIGARSFFRLNERGIQQLEIGLGGGAPTARESCVTMDDYRYFVDDFVSDHLEAAVAAWKKSF